jgi:transposase
MDHFAGLDVSVKYTRVCIVESMGFGALRLQAGPDALLQVLRNPTYRFKRIGFEAGRLSQ